MPTEYHKNAQYNPPDTFVRTSHALTIYGPGNQKVGLIQSWSPQMSRDITPIYDIDAESSGLILEKVPGNITNLTISVNRYDIWTVRMEQAFGTIDLTMLSNQQAPFQVEEIWKLPSGNLERWLYKGCWFSSIGRSLSSTGDRLVQVDATLEYVYRQKEVT